MNDKKKMPRTLEEIEALDKVMLIPTDIAGYLQCDPYNINIAAATAPETLGFPVIRIGSRTKIPKEGFLRFCRGLQKQEEAAG